MVRIGNVEIGGNKIVVMAGPCSVESRDQIERAADIVADGGAKVIRGGAFKPRSSPYSFQGMGEEGLQLLRAAADRRGLLVISEVMDSTQIPVMLQYCRYPADRRPQHAELQSAARSAESCGSRYCSSAVFRRLSKNCCSPPNTFSPAATTM